MCSQCGHERPDAKERRSARARGRVLCDDCHDLVALWDEERQRQIQQMRIAISYREARVIVPRTEAYHWFGGYHVDRHLPEPPPGVEPPFVWE